MPSEGPSRVLVEKGKRTVLGRGATYSVYAHTQGRKRREVLVGLYRTPECDELDTTFSSYVHVERGLLTPLYERLTGREFDPISTEEQIGRVLDKARVYVAKEESVRSRFDDGSTDTGVVECSFGCGRSISPDDIKPTGWLIDGSVVNRDDVFHACPHHVDVLRELEEVDDGVEDAQSLADLLGGDDGA